MTKIRIPSLVNGLIQYHAKGKKKYISKSLPLSLMCRHSALLCNTFIIYYIIYFTVKPDKVKIEKVNATMAEWSYPESWSSPHSYFPLVSQVVVRKNCKKCGNCTGRNNGQVLNLIRLPRLLSCYWKFSEDEVHG